VDWLWNMSAHIEEHPMIEGPANPAPRPARRSNTDQRRIRLREFDSVTSAGDDVPGSNSPRSAYKVAWVVRFKEGMTREEGREYWRSVHGPIFKELNIDRYVQNHVVGPIGEEGETDDAEIGFDGFSECWFRDQRQFLDAIESDTWAVAVEDARNVFDMTQMWGAALEENVVIEPELTGA